MTTASIAATFNLLPAAMLKDLTIQLEKHLRANPGYRWEHCDCPAVTFQGGRMIQHDWNNTGDKFEIGSEELTKLIDSILSDFGLEEEWSYADFVEFFVRNPN